jgi:hypothetical protein
MYVQWWRLPFCGLSLTISDYSDVVIESLLGDFQQIIALWTNGATYLWNLPCLSEDESSLIEINLSQYSFFCHQLHLNYCLPHRSLNCDAYARARFAP